MDKPTPRINSSLREKFVGQTVRVSGKLVSVSSNLFIFSPGNCLPTFPPK